MREALRRSRRCALDTTISHPYMALTTPTELLPSGRNVEALGTPKYRSTLRCHHQPPPVRFGLDVRREPNGIHRKLPRRIDLLSCVFLVLRCSTRLPPLQTSDVANGLNFLHSCNVVHGDLKEVREYPRSHLNVVLTTPSRTSSWTLLAMHESQDLVLLPRAWTRLKPLYLSMATAHNVSQRRFWIAWGRIARRDIFASAIVMVGFVCGPFNTGGWLTIPCYDKVIR